MTSAVAILTYRRLPTLAKMLEGVITHCVNKGGQDGSPGVPVAVFEDHGMVDGTNNYLVSNSPGEPVDELAAVRHRLPWGEAFLGTDNLGVAGNSNRALRWFEQGGWDHLCLCNDDLEVLGDFPAFYLKAHRDLGIDFFCFNDFWKWPTHRWAVCRSRGYRLRIFRQMTGIMMSVTRPAFEKVGYFDTRFGKFGQEHCDWTNRFRFTGGIRLDGQDQPCVDVEPTKADGSPDNPVLQHQECPTSVVGDERDRADQEALDALKLVSQEYGHKPVYRPFSLRNVEKTGGLLGKGVPKEQMPGYAQVISS